MLNEQGSGLCDRSYGFIGSQVDGNILSSPLNCLQDNLTLYKADLCSLIPGCIGLFHSASPVVFSPELKEDGEISPSDPDLFINFPLLDFVPGAWQGSLNVLRSAAAYAPSRESC